MLTVDTFNPLDLSGKKFMVTGASSRIGCSTSLYLSKLGATIVLVGRSIERLVETMELMPSGNHMYLQYDFLENDDFSMLFNQATGDGKRLNGIVHCAGIPYVLPIRMMKRDRVLQALNINFMSYIELVRLYAMDKYSEGGSIVGISSVAAEKGDKCQTLYTAAKAAMDAATQTLSIELQLKNIRINTVLPGMIETEIIKSTEMIGADTTILGKSQIMGMGKPDDVASVCAFLLSDMARFITGRRIFVDGGRFL